MESVFNGQYRLGEPESTSLPYLSMTVNKLRRYFRVEKLIRYLEILCKWEFMLG